MKERFGVGCINLVIAIVAYEVWYQTGSIPAILGSALTAGMACAMFIAVVRDLL